MSVDIYIREKDGNREIRVPILPEKVTCKSGENKFITYDIMNRGEVSVPSGTELSTFSWESEFVGERFKNDPRLRGDWQPPKNYHSILEDWKAKGIALNLIVTGYPINTDVYLYQYTSTLTGAFGGISYELSFLEARDITIKTTTVETTTSSRPTSTASTYTIKSGDTLWGIAKKFYGSGTKWKTIYDANKDIIEATAKARGRKSSDNGHWIYPGVTLTIPGVSGSSSTSSGTGKTTGTASGTSTDTNTTTSASKESTEAYTQEYLEARQEAIDKYLGRYTQ